MPSPESNPHTTPPARRRTTWFVVAYDIVDDKRRQRVMKTVEAYGVRAQYSLFECDLPPARMEQLLTRLAELIDPAVDDIRIYTLCESCLQKTHMLGKATRYARRTHAIV